MYFLSDFAFHFCHVFLKILDSFHKIIDLYFISQILICYRNRLVQLFREFEKFRFIHNLQVTGNSISQISPHVYLIVKVALDKMQRIIIILCI